MAVSFAVVPGVLCNRSAPSTELYVGIQWGKRRSKFRGQQFSYLISALTSKWVRRVCKKLSLSFERERLWARLLKGFHVARCRWSGAGAPEELET